MAKGDEVFNQKKTPILGAGKKKKQRHNGGIGPISGGQLQRTSVLERVKAVAGGRPAESNGHNYPNGNAKSEEICNITAENGKTHVCAIE